MNHAEQKPKVRSFTGPTAPSPLVARPPVTNGEPVPTRGTSPVAPGCQGQPDEQAHGDERQPFTWTSVLPTTSLVLTNEEQAQQQSERDRLLGLCRHLRRTHSCPGECVLSPGRQERLFRELRHDEVFGDGRYG